MIPVLRSMQRVGAGLMQPAALRACWLLGVPVAAWSASWINPWFIAFWQDPHGPFGPAPRILLAHYAPLVVVTLATAWAIRVAAGKPTDALAASTPSFVLVGIAGLAIVAAVACGTPAARTVAEWDDLLSPYSLPGTPSPAPNHSVPHAAVDGLDEAFSVRLAFPRDTVEPIAIPLGDHVMLVRAEGGHAAAAIAPEQPSSGPFGISVLDATTTAVTVYRLGDRWFLSTIGSPDRWARPSRGLLRSPGAPRGLSALAILPRPLGAPGALAWMLALAPVLGGTLLIASLRARRRIGAIADAVDTPHYRLSAATDRETRIAETRTQIARLEALAVLVMILLATPGLVALARGLTLSLGLR